MTESTTTHRPSSHSKQSQGGRSHPPRGHTSTSRGGGVKLGNNKKTKKGKKGQKLDPFMLGFSVHAAERPNIGDIQMTTFSQSVPVQNYSNFICMLINYLSD